jgi:putative colanic acid biosynthesis acetyltransferase WcaF
MNKAVELSRFSNKWYNPGNPAKRVLWYILSIIFYKSSIPYPGFIKVLFLRMLGARVGAGVVIKPSVTIKYPWFLEIGDNSWIGEGVYINSLGTIRIGKNVCISQDAYIETGNHDYKKESFDLIIKDVTIEDGSWVGARAVVCPGITVRTHSVITAGSVITHDTESHTIYQGNPAQAIRKRVIE